MSRVVVTACADFPGHARRVVREALCPSCVVAPVPEASGTAVTLGACAVCDGRRWVSKMGTMIPCRACGGGA